MTDVRSETMEMITVLEASRRTGVPLSAIYRAIDAGQLAAYRSGDDVKVRADDLAALTHSS